MSRTGRADAGPLVGIPLAIGVVVLGQVLEGGSLFSLLQPTAALVVFGGTLAALLLSFPFPTLRRAFADVQRVFAPPLSSTDSLVALFTEHAARVRRAGIMSLESLTDSVDDPFLRQALEHAVDGLPSTEVRQALEQRSRALEDSDEESAEVLEAAAGYAPTLGILGAVLGLIHVMENLAAPGRIGAGIAVAFVATIYGVGVANLIFLPLATRLRAIGRAAAARRELTIEGTISLQQGLHPRLVATQLSRSTSAWPPPAPPAKLTVALHTEQRVEL
jgi:chemotaxis protein MotA